MFWTFILAHLIGDYPLQTKRLVDAKQRLPGLLLHVGIHWTVLTVLTFQVYVLVWPAVLAITAAHFLIDASKTFVSHRRSDWVIVPYVIDQLLHISTLILAALWVQKTGNLSAWKLLSPWMAYAIGLVLVTVFWFITESILVYRYENLSTLIAMARWPRMAARFVLFLLFVLATPITLILAVFSLLVLVSLYQKWGYPTLWLAVDPLVAVIGALLSRGILAFV